MRWSRWWPALLYVAAAVLAQSFHDHHGAAEAAARCEASCADTRTHLSGHSAPDLGHAPSDCLACQYRAEHHSWIPTAPLFLRPSAALAADESSPPASPRPFRRASCRAPPRV